jgi:hypothetical protein
VPVKVTWNARGKQRYYLLAAASPPPLTQLADLTRLYSILQGAEYRCQYAQLGLSTTNNPGCDIQNVCSQEFQYNRATELNMVQPTKTKMPIDVSIRRDIGHHCPAIELMRRHAGSCRYSVSQSIEDIRRSPELVCELRGSIMSLLPR